MEVIIGSCLLRSVLSKHDISTKELISRTGMSKQQVNSYLNEGRVMTLSTAIKVSFVIGCCVLDLYEWKITSSS